MSCDVKKRAVGFELPILQKACQHGESMTGEDLVDEGGLAMERFEGAAAWFVVFWDCAVGDLGEEFGGCSEAGFPAWIAAIEWLAEDELASGRSVSDV